MDAAAAHMTRRADAALFEPGERGRLEIRLIDRAVRTVSHEQRGILSVERDALAMNDRQRHRCAIVTACLGLDELDVAWCVVRATRLQSVVGPASRPRIVAKELVAAIPCFDANEHAHDTRVGADELERALVRQRDLLGARAAVGEAHQARGHCVAELYVQRILRRRGGDDNASLRREERGRHRYACDVGPIETGLHDPVAWRILVCQQVQRTARHRHPGDLVVGSEQLRPVRALLQNVVEARDPGTELTLRSVDDECDRMLLVRRNEYQRHVRRLHRDSARRFAAENRLHDAIRLPDPAQVDLAPAQTIGMCWIERMLGQTVVEKTALVGQPADAVVAGIAAIEVGAIDRCDEIAAGPHVGHAQRRRVRAALRQPVGQPVAERR